MNVLNIHGYGAKAFNTSASALSSNDYFPVSPQLDYDQQSPGEILRFLLDTYEQEQCSAVVGSSMGGFFAMQVSVYQSCPAVLINPCVTPYIILPRLGEHAHRHFVQEYLNLTGNLSRLRPELVHVIIGEKDDVIDTHDFIRYYIGEGNCVTVPGGGHPGSSLPLQEIFAKYGETFFEI